MSITVDSLEEFACFGPEEFVDCDTSALDAAEMRADKLEEELNELADKYELLTRRFVDLKQRLSTPVEVDLAEALHMQEMMESDPYRDEDLF